MIIWCDVKDSDGDVLGEGPISLTSATATRLIDGSGGIKLDCPSSVRARELLTPGRYVDVWIETESGNVLLGQGIIKKDGLSNTGDKLSIDCNDLMEELKYDNTLFNWNIDGDTVQQAISDLISVLGWTVEASGAALTARVTLPFKGETKLKAMLATCEATGVHVRLTNREGRLVQVGPFGDLSGITLTDASSGAGGDETTGILEGLTMERQGDQLANRILAEGGAFSGGTNITLADSTRAAIFSILGRDGGLNYYREDVVSVAAYGVRWLYKSYPNTKPLSASAAHRIAASNQLSDQAAADLADMSVIRRNYKGKVRGLTTLLLPGDTVKVLYNEPIYQEDGSLWTGGALNEALYINRAETYAGEGGWWQNVDLSNVNAQRVDAATDVAISVERTKKG